MCTCALVSSAISPALSPPHVPLTTPPSTPLGPPSQGPRTATAATNATTTLGIIRLASNVRRRNDPGRRDYASTPGSGWPRGRRLQSPPHRSPARRHPRAANDVEQPAPHGLHLRL